MRPEGGKKTERERWLKEGGAKASHLIERIRLNKLSLHRLWCGFKQPVQDRPLFRLCSKPTSSGCGSNRAESTSEPAGRDSLMMCSVPQLAAVSS